jgi:hypothetical protein
LPRSNGAWKNTSQGDREVQQALRRTLLKYKLHTDQDLFDKAYSYIRQYYLILTPPYVWTIVGPGTLDNSPPDFLTYPRHADEVSQRFNAASFCVRNGRQNFRANHFSHANN